jgi:hypothetical protein
MHYVHWCKFHTCTIIGKHAQAADYRIKMLHVQNRSLCRSYVLVSLQKQAVRSNDKKSALLSMEKKCAVRNTEKESAVLIMEEEA